MGHVMQDIYAAQVADGVISDDPAQRGVLPLLENIRVHFANLPEGGGLLASLFSKAPQPPKGIYIWGGVGRGKSFLMDMFFDAVPTEGKRRVHFHAFMQEIHSGMNEVRRTGADDALKPVADRVADDVRLLCFDEMQITDITDAMIVGRLFEALIGAGVVIVTTSNRTPDDLYKDGLNRQLFLPFIDFLKERLVVHELTSQTDYRKEKLSGSDVYFHPANAAARDAIDSIWQELTGGVTQGLVLHVKGREIVLSDHLNGVARAPFWELCGKPLGAADYLSLVQNVRVLLLEDVPRLSRSNFNEARRFVTLIDTLYEGKVRLIMSAADIPERLYVEGEGSFEFERTASRLREMQGADWGKE